MIILKKYKESWWNMDIKEERQFKKLERKISMLEYLLKEKNKILEDLFEYDEIDNKTIALARIKNDQINKIKSEYEGDLIG